MVVANLPSLPTPFIGRNKELRDIQDLLTDSSCRLLTLIGPGGMGKTRLALEVARQVSFVRDVYFVPLQGLASSGLLVCAIADAIEFHFYESTDPEPQLLAYLRDKSLLLVLDNFEHVLDGASLLAEIYPTAPGVDMLVTSRERLNLVEEWVYDVPQLKFPSSETETEIEDYSAIQFFIQNARRTNFHFALTASQKPFVIRICQRVGGLPLGIELAAAWTRTLSSEIIAEEIERSLDILETFTHNIDPRHRNIRAVFEPSWTRLPDEARMVFTELSVFRGGFTLEAAEYVARVSRQILALLVDKSLLRLDVNGRYYLHELLRQYGEEHLRGNPEAWQ
ncbi:MAG TPA: AAA family ATPase, partial [Phototrophicaceae bacterium]|nr:AAA family ATPase [Phototrophicaceae bacterium]